MGVACRLLAIYRFHSDKEMAKLILEAEEEVVAGRLAPGTASDQLIDNFLNQSRTN